MYSQARCLNYLIINQRFGLTLNRPFRTSFNVSRLQVFQNYASTSIVESFSELSDNVSKKGKKPKKSNKSPKQKARTSETENKEKKLRKKKVSLLSTEKVNEMSNNLLQDLCQSKNLSEKFSLKPLTAIENIDDIIESYKPVKEFLTSIEFRELVNKIDKAFIVSQLKAFLKKRDLDYKLKKVKLIEKLISEVWKVEIKVEEQYIQAKPIDLFFMLGPDGKTLRELESQSNVKIKIDLKNLSYTIAGSPQDIEKAKDMIKRVTSYQSVTMELPSHIKNNNKSLQEIPFVQDICMSLRIFIEVDTNKQLIISGPLQQNIKEASRLLNFAWHQPDQNETDLLLCNDTANFNEYSFFPIHDSETMSLYNRYLNWHRVGRVGPKVANESTLSDRLHILYESKSFSEGTSSRFLNIQNNLTNLNKLGIFLFDFLKESQPAKSKFEICSVFGYNIFHDEKNVEKNLFVPPLSDNFSYKMLEEWIKENSHLRTFLPSYPNSNFLNSLKMPIIKFQEFVQFDYIPLKSNSYSSYERLSILLEVNDFAFKFKEATLCKERLLADLLLMDCPTDLRLSAMIKESVDDSLNTNDFIKECLYKSARDILCPKEYVFSLNSKGEKIKVPYNLERMKLYTTSYYDHNGFTLTISKISELETSIVRPEIKLIYKPTSISNSQTIENLFNSSSELNKKGENENHELTSETKISNEKNDSYSEQWKIFILTSLEIINDIGK
ncbi:unnamed protein product [Rhizophagus irregularis]|nr:unnamed protein product [Rhizophagus irregularis]